jgi:Leucine-rich repeat (LRR) protein
MEWTITEYNLWIDCGRPINLLVTKLNISYSKISSLKGIGNLVNLTELYCYKNQLTSLKGIENLVNLTILYCNYNQLTSLNEIENLVNLTILCCGRNQLTSLNKIENLVNLTILYCNDNQLTSLNEIENLVNLTTLHFGNNQLTSLNEIENLVNLTTLHCGRNELTSLNKIEILINLTTLECCGNELKSLKGIENLVNLTKLDCSFNKLTSLNEIENLVNLTTLNCYFNQLTSLNGIENLVNLTKLYCGQNQLTSLNEIENLVNLTVVNYNNNLIVHIPPNLVRRLNRLTNEQNIYNDSQNVHNHNIQESIRTSVNNILKIKPIITDTTDLILTDTILTNETKEILMEYKNSKDIYSALNITFEELLLYVFNRIEINEHKDEIKRVLNTEMTESVCKCFTGRMSRLINCLNGFDPLVNIQIAGNEQIGQVIHALRVNLERENKYEIKLHKELAREQLRKRKYDESVIEEWVEQIE